MVITTDHSNLKSTVIQMAVSILANCGMVNSGMAIGFPSAVVPPLLGSGPGLHATLNQASWVAGLSFVCAPVACLLAGPLIDWLGRRKGLLLLNLLYTSGWLIMALFSQSLYSLYLGRLLTGLGLGLASCVTVTYTAEVTTVNLRTSMVMLTPVMLAVGTFLIYLWALLYQDSWTEASYFGFGITMLSLILSTLLPESPLWLQGKGRTEEALQALMRLRGASAPEQVKEELNTFNSRVKDKQDKNSWLDTLHNFQQPQVYKPLIIINIFVFFLHSTGSSIINVFAVDFTRNAEIEGQAYYIALGIASIRLFSTFFTSWICSRYGRKGPAILTGIVTGISVMALAISLFLNLSPWIVGTLILIYVFSNSICFFNMPWSMLGEMFPTNVRGVASGLTICILYFETFTAVKLYPITVLSFGAFPVLVFFGICAISGTLFLHLFLPETHGKTLLEIEEYFKGTRKTERR